MKTRAILIALLTLTTAGFLAPGANADVPNAVPQKVVLHAELTRAAVLLNATGDVGFFVFLDEGETPRLQNVGDLLQLQIVKGEDDHLTGEFLVPHAAGEALPTLAIRDLPRETIAPGVLETTPAPGVSDPTHAKVPDPTAPHTTSYSIAYCQYDQSCVQTRMDEGCSCIQHWARVSTSTSTWFMYGCDDAHACQVIAGNPGGPWDSGWRCQVHTNPFPWNIKAWTELWKGQSVWASDVSPGPITYFWSRTC